MVDQHAEPAARAGPERRDLLRPARRCRPAAPPRRPRSAGRRPRSARPGRRRGCPRPRSGSPGRPGPVRRDRDRAGRGAAGAAGAAPAAAGRRRVTGCAVEQERGRVAAGKLRRLPCRSSSTTAPDSKPTTAPQKPESASSTTRSGSASTSGITLRRRQLPASTSSPYIDRHVNPWSAPRRPATRRARDNARGRHVPLPACPPQRTRRPCATRRSTRFVAWVRAWRAGLVPYDELADEIAGDEEHLVADAPGTWTDVPLREAPRRPSSKLHPRRDPAGAAGARRPARAARPGPVHRRRAGRRRGA